MIAVDTQCRSDRGLSEPQMLAANVVEPNPNERLGVTRRDPIGTLGLVELILKDRDGLERLIRDSAVQPLLIPRLLVIALVAFVLFGIELSLVFSSAREWPQLFPIRDVIHGDVPAAVTFESAVSGESRLVHWVRSAPKLTAAYAVGLIAATGVCLPSLYFYGLLAGVRMTMMDVVIHALKSKATGAVALVGILPIYAAFGLGIVIFDVADSVRHLAFWLGMILPFLAGLLGTYSLYFGFVRLADTLPAERRCRRECFLRRLVLSWAACYTAVTPVMIHTLWVAWR